MRSRNYSRLTAWVLATVLTLALAGCSGTPEDNANVEVHFSVPSRDLSKWSMPLDEFMYSTAAMRNSDYAENLLVEKCMESSGFEWTIPKRDTTASDGPSWNSAGVRLLNVDLARVWGYHIAPTNDVNTAALRKFELAHLPMPPAEQDIFDKCLQLARKSLPVLPGWVQSAATFTNDAVNAALKNPTVVKAAKKWRSCMSQLGIPDLPSRPYGMPSPSIRERYQTSVFATSGSVIDPTEIEIAQKDFACQRQFHYEGAFYDATWKEQLKQLKKHASDLARIQKMLATHAQAVNTVIRTVEPSEPQPPVGG